MANAAESPMCYEIVESHDRRCPEVTMHIEYTLYVNMTGVHEEDISTRKQLKITISKNHNKW